MDDHPVEAGLTFTTTEKIAIGITSPIWVLLSLIALVFGAPAVGVMAVKSMLENRNKILKYEEDKCAFMKEAGMMKTKNGDEQTVALKIYAESLTAENVSDIVNKFELLKKLNHPNVVTFHGMSFMKDDGQTRIILIMEYCMGNLKDHILKNPEITPAKSKNADAKRDACEWIKKITAALSFIHNQNVVHRDLKLDNVLVWNLEKSLKSRIILVCFYAFPRKSINHFSLTEAKGNYNHT
ncbi:NUAK family SNF1-like kinase 2 [Stylophora pistillata]|uniref:NUAK family SNF1-like kinase 2 n=1 Tax=Stylophora pistillata TaxID=50429 RepID=UPI000C03AE2A|nr:NUAK family SNF1-like kinase 2 [Stylophora pistillata]